MTKTVLKIAFGFNNLIVSNQNNTTTNTSTKGQINLR